jgi:rRNA maturation endonuclease Nob1
MPQRPPSQKFLDNVKASASELGDSFRLSVADLQLLALASELKAEGFTPQLVSDDYSVQNVATQSDIDFFALATFGIKAPVRMDKVLSSLP